MNKIFFKILLSFLIFLSAANANKIAVVTKVKGMVEIMPTGKKLFSKLKAGSILADGDKIRTGTSGFAAIIFIDDKSTLKLKGNSEAVITGQRTAASISKKINMDSGTIRATIKKQNSSFVIQTPTSVASVKGTDFWLLTDPDKGDQVIGLEGIVSLKNIDTGQDVDVVQGMSGISTPDGDVGVEETVASSIPTDPSESSEDGPSQFKIYLEGPNGTQKVMVIEYQ
ncbi:FecR family protein [Candidatus Marinimicrobia bacterium]|nr:FecR family protein [Candidatus Neomarinimicrobiota bacterium]